LEKEMLSNLTLEEALHPFGWGTHSKTSIITMRTILKEILRIAIEKAQKEK